MWTRWKALIPINVLTRWDPLQEMLDLRRAMDQIVQRTGAGATFQYP